MYSYPTSSLKNQRVQCCEELLKLFRKHGHGFLGSNMLVQDESWFYWESSERRQVWVEHENHDFPYAAETKTIVTNSTSADHINGRNDHPLSFPVEKRAIRTMPLKFLSYLKYFLSYRDILDHYGTT